MKKVGALLLAAVFVFSFALSGCSSKSSGDNSVPESSEGPYKIGYLNWGQGVPVLDGFQDQAKYVNDILGNTMTAVSDKFSADQQMTNIQNMIASGVDGIMFDAVPATLTPKIAKTLLDAKVPFLIYDHVPSDQLHNELSENPYYAGAVSIDNMSISRAMADLAISDGSKTALIVGGAVGDSSMDELTQGFTKEFEAKGGKVLGVARCADPSESAVKSEDLISANRNADLVYTLTGDFAPGALTAKKNLGLNLKVYSSHVDANTLTAIDQGQVVAGDGGTNMAAAFGAILLENFLEGHKIVSQDGTVPNLRLPLFAVNSKNTPVIIVLFSLILNPSRTIKSKRLSINITMT